MAISLALGGSPAQAVRAMQVVVIKKMTADTANVMKAYTEGTPATTVFKAIRPPRPEVTK